MLRETFEEYLDGELDAVSRLKVEKGVAEDSRSAALMAALRSQRALRAAAMESYAPDKGEARALASHVLALCEVEANRPLGRILPAAKRMAAVAAAIVVVAGAFMAGRTTAPVQRIAGPVQVQEVTKYSVAFKDPETGVWSVTERDSDSAAADVIKTLQQEDQPLVLNNRM